jgi:hypothetical protein
VKQTLVIATLVFFLLGVAHADRFIVTRKGDGIWATRASREGNNIVYTDKDTGEARSIPETSLEAVIPTVKRGKNYKTEDINKYIERIKKAKLKHRRLKRPLNALLSDWNALLKPAEDLSGEIQALVTGFVDGDLSLSAYKDAGMELGMLAYKDKREDFADEIKAAQSTIRETFLSTAKKTITSRAEAKTVSLNDFAGLKKMEKELDGIAGDSELAEIRATTERARLTALNSNYQKIRKMLSAKEVRLDSFLLAIGTLKRMQREIAAGEKELQALSRLEQQTDQKMKKTVRGFRFDARGYPLRADDHEKRRQMAGGSRSVRFQSIELDEQCFVVPLARHGSIPVSGQTRLPLRLVFNQVCDGFDYGVRVAVLSDGRMQEYTHPLSDVRLRDGHAEIEITEDFGFLPSDFSLVAVSGASPAAYFYIVSRAENAAEDAWSAISLALGWPLTR